MQIMLYVKYFKQITFNTKKKNQTCTKRVIKLHSNIFLKKQIYMAK